MLISEYDGSHITNILATCYHNARDDHLIILRGLWYHWALLILASSSFCPLVFFVFSSDIARNQTKNLIKLLYLSCNVAMLLFETWFPKRRTPPFWTWQLFPAFEGSPEARRHQGRLGLVAFQTLSKLYMLVFILSQPETSLQSSRRKYKEPILRISGEWS